MTEKPAEGSRQLQTYRQARANGCDPKRAAFLASITEAEAELIEADQAHDDSQPQEETTKMTDQPRRGRPPKAKPADAPADVVEQLGKDLAADHALEKAGAAPVKEPTAEEVFRQPDAPVGEGTAQAGEISAENDPETVAEGTALDPGPDGGAIEVAGVVLEPVEDDDDDDDDLDPHLERVVGMVEAAQFESGTLVGDITEAMMTAVKNNPKGWAHMSESQIRDLYRHFEKVAQKAVRKATIVIAEGEQLAVHAKLKDYSAKDGFTIKLTALADEDTALLLFHLQGHEVIITSADATKFGGKKREPDIPLDQPELGFADTAPPAKVRADPPEHLADDSDLAAAGEADDIVVEEDGDQAGADVANNFLKGAGDQGGLESAPVHNPSPDAPETDEIAGDGAGLDSDGAPGADVGLDAPRINPDDDPEEDEEVAAVEDAFEEDDLTVANRNAALLGKGGDDDDPDFPDD